MSGAYEETLHEEFNPSNFKFGDVIENGWASASNPTRTGYFVRRGTTPRGRMNSGSWIEITNGKGQFWRLPSDNKDYKVKRVALAALSKL